LLIDARHLSPDTQLTCDVCIVGSGPAGITIARRLIGSRLSVNLLEAGGTHYELGTQTLYRGRVVGDPYYRLDGCRWRMFGGTSNRWGGWCRPLDPVDYTQRDWLPLSGWPIDTRHLERYEVEAARLCELPNARFDLECWRDRMSPPFMLDDTNFENAVIQHSPEPNFAQIHGPAVVAAANIQTILHANVTQIVLDSESRRVRELKVATLTGRRFAVRAKAVVLAVGGIENARLLMASRTDRQSGVGNEFDMVGRCFMEHLHVALGHLASMSARLDTGFYRRQAAAELRGVLAPTAAAQEQHRLLSTSIGFEWPSFSLSTPFLGWPPAAMLGPVRLYSELRARGYARTVGCIRRLTDRAWSMPSRIASRRRARKAAAAANVASSNGMLYSVYFRAEQAPDPVNRVCLDGDRRDGLGVPMTRLEWKVRPFDESSIVRWLELLKQDLRAKGIGDVILPPEKGQAEGWRDRVIGGPHHMGTTRMSTDPRHGVVNADCRVHSVENLYIAGSSVFATSGHANPTFTILCLALRLADRLRDKL
jgi:choline dehydrogenase-like flavoprotein